VKPIDALYQLAWAVGLAASTPYGLVRTFLHPREMRERRADWRTIAPEAVGGLWVHAASVGEARAAERLLGPIAARGRPALLSVVTPAARGLAAEFAAAGASDVRFAPLDFLPLVHRAFDLLQPKGVLILETEIWPGLLTEARRRGVPVAFVSARLTRRSWRRLRAIRPLLRQWLAGTCVAAQSERDARRWIDLGAPASRVRVTGNIKYELPRPIFEAAEREARRVGWQRIVVFGSVRAEEVDEVAAAVRRAAQGPEPFLAIVAPRHPERTAVALQRALGGTLPIVERARVDDVMLPAPGEIQALRGAADVTRAVLLVTTLGELRRFYALADAIFVGGTLAPIGGHNLFEAAASAVPILFGPHTENVSEVADLLLRDGGGERVADGAALGAALRRLLADEVGAAEMGRAAHRVAESMSGALDRTFAALEEWGFPIQAVEPVRMQERPPGLLRPTKKPG
jgi:3-deoxy-D-manno-octulosonic-acid transferase